MKKILTVALATIMTAACVGGLSVSAAAAQTASENSSVAAPAAAEAAQTYLVPGSWYDGKTKETKYNTVSGLTALTEAEKEALHLEKEPNIYRAGAAGSELPEPVTEKTDAEGKPFVFQGWWYIEDASVTYTETVPETDGILYLYADFRAAASQRHDPVTPPEQVGGGEKNFLLITHEDGSEDVVPLLVSGTDVWNVYDMGYGSKVQFFNEYFTLKKNDRIKVYLTDIGTSDRHDDEPFVYPKPTVGPGYKYFSFSLESSGSNSTSDYLFADSYGLDGSGVVEDGEEPEMAYIPQETMTFRIYIKVEAGGSGMREGRLQVYMERKA